MAKPVMTATHSSRKKSSEVAETNVPTKAAADNNKPSKIIYALVYLIALATSIITHILVGKLGVSNEGAKLMCTSILTPFVLGTLSYFIAEPNKYYSKIVSGITIFSLLLFICGLILFSTQKHTNNSTANSVQSTPIPADGWIMNRQGELVPNIRPGETAMKGFMLRDGTPSPVIVLPENGYRLRFDNLQAIYVEENGVREFVDVNEHWRGGITKGQTRRLRFWAADEQADVIIQIKKL